MKALLCVTLATLSISVFAKTLPCNLGEVKYFKTGSTPTEHGYTRALGETIHKDDSSIISIARSLEAEYDQTNDLQTLPDIDVLQVDGTTFTPYLCTNGIWPNIYSNSEPHYLGTIKTYLFPTIIGKALVSTERSVLLSTRSHPALEAFLLPELISRSFVNIPMVEVNAKIKNNLTGKSGLNTYAAVQGHIMSEKISCIKGEVIFSISHAIPANTYEIDGSQFTNGSIYTGEAFSARVLVCK